MRIQSIGNAQYDLPGGGQNSLSLGAQATYSAQVQGTLDVPTGTQASGLLPVPFGAIGTAKGFFLKANGVAVQVAINGATGAPQSLGTGGFMFKLSPAPAAKGVIQSILIITINQQQVDGASVDFAVWGD